MKHYIPVYIAAMLFLISAGLMAETSVRANSTPFSICIYDDRAEIRQALQERMKELAKELPLDCGEEVSIEAIKVEGDNIVIDMTINLGDIPFEFISLMEKDIKQAVLDVFLEEYVNADKGLLTKAGLGLKILIKDKNSSARHNIHIYVNEIVMGTAAKTMSKNKKQEAYNLLKMIVWRMQKAETSAEMEDSIKFDITHDCLTITLKVDERKVNLDELKESFSQISPKELVSEMTDAEMITLCKTAEVNIKICCSGLHGAKGFELLFPYTDF